MSKFKVVVIDSFVEAAELDLTKEFMPKIIKSRGDGYGSRHGKRFLPFGVEDFVCIHLVICKEIAGSLEPVLLSKVIPNSRCDFYRIENPLIKNMRSCFEKCDIEHVKNMITKHSMGNDDCSYSGGYTINKKYLSSKEEIDIIKEMYCAFHAFLHLDYSLGAIFASATVKFHTQDMLKLWGIIPIEFDGKIKTGRSKGLNFEEMMPIWGDVNKISFYTQRMMEKYSDIWELRLRTRDSMRKEELQVA